MRQDILSRKREIEQWVKESRSKSFICVELNCKPATLERYLGIMGITYAGNQGLKGIKTFKKRHATHYLVHGKLTPSNKLKKKLIQDGLKTARCEHCLLSEWRGKPMPLELHHKDGNRTNNLLSNLEILCPNCHTFTENYSGRASRIKDKPKRRYLRTPNKTCVVCGGKTSNRKFCSKSCYGKGITRKSRRPTLDILSQDVKRLTFKQLGKKYGVSSSAVRKWVKQHGVLLPRKPKTLPLFPNYTGH